MGQGQSPGSGPREAKPPETPGFWWSPSCPSFLLSVLCFCVLIVFIVCLVCLMLPVSRFPFLIAPSVFSKIYLATTYFDIQETSYQ